MYAYPQQAAPAYVAPNGLLIQANGAAPAPSIIDYSGNLYAAAQIPGAYAATDVAAAAGTGKLFKSFH